MRSTLYAETFDHRQQAHRPRATAASAAPPARAQKTPPAHDTRAAVLGVTAQEPVTDQRPGATAARTAVLLGIEQHLVERGVVGDEA
jgi:hypothetical protein